MAVFFRGEQQTFRGIIAFSPFPLTVGFFPHEISMPFTRLPHPAFLSRHLRPLLSPRKQRFKLPSPPDAILYLFSPCDFLSLACSLVESRCADVLAPPGGACVLVCAECRFSTVAFHSLFALIFSLSGRCFFSPIPNPGLVSPAFRYFDCSLSPDWPPPTPSRGPTPPRDLFAWSSQQ